MICIQVSVPFLVNQLGSLLHYYTISNSDMSVTVPLTNSLTVFFTMLASLYLQRSRNKSKRMLEIPEQNNKEKYVCMYYNAISSLDIGL